MAHPHSRLMTVLDCLSWINSFYVASDERPTGRTVVINLSVGVSTLSKVGDGRGRWGMGMRCPLPVERSSGGDMPFARKFFISVSGNGSFWCIFAPFFPSNDLGAAQHKPQEYCRVLQYRHPLPVGAGVWRQYWNSERWISKKTLQSSNSESNASWQLDFSTKLCFWFVMHLHSFAHSLIPIRQQGEQKKRIYVYTQQEAQLPQRYAFQRQPMWLSLIIIESAYATFC